MRRLSGIVLAAVMLAVLPAATAAGYVGAPDFRIKESRATVKADGPGFDVKLTRQGLDVRINDARFGIPEAGFPIQRGAQDLGPVGPNLRPFVCENGTYQLTSGVFNTVQRGSSTEPRPLPYTPAFNARFPNVFTFVGTLDATVTDENGEELRMLMSDLAHEVLTDRWFASTNPIHAFFVDADGRVRDRASLVGRVNIHRKTGKAFHWILDRGTCHQTANLDLGPGTDRATVFGPFFVLPFNTSVVRLGGH
jgi:hypothetical protein